jgi:4-diphosphocytidyl-2-C-methyl-D-erythritol kinase
VECDLVTAEALSVRSWAKINWNLRVLCRRPDGFHEIESLVSAVTLCDDLTFSGRSDATFELTCDHPDVPTDEGNLIRRAAELLAGQADRDVGMRCHLTKRIPIGGGLGGGSSNAAATLVALNHLWSLNRTTEQLMETAAQLGSDVAFFVQGRTAVMSGRGERISPVSLGWRGYIVLLMPGLSVSTPAVYHAWKPDRAGSSQHPVGPVACDSAAKWMEHTFNMLESPAFAVCPELKKLFDQANDMADRPIRMSGSGSTMFTAFDALAEAESFATGVRSQLGIETSVVQPVEQT